MFAKRTNWDLTPNDLARALAERRAQGLPVSDLTLSNPTECGFEYDSEAILHALGNRAAMRYEPDPKGLEVARKAVSGYYADRGELVSAENIFITTSTSEAYSWIFRLLCDPGDELLIPSPGYPLFDLLADIHDIKLVRYPLFYDQGWHYDLHALEQGITGRTRAVIVIHPNNPTGNYCKSYERDGLNEMCATHRLAIIADEVFLDFALDGGARRSFVNNGHFMGGDERAGDGCERRSSSRRVERVDAVPERSGSAGAKPLTFTLSGLSKICGLPQMKIGWVVASGSEAVEQEAMSRLEIIADTYLSPSAPLQLAVPALLSMRDAFQKQVIDRIHRNLGSLRAQGAAGAFEVLALEGGWCGILRWSSRPSGLAERHLSQGVYLHPGSLYGLDPPTVVISLIVPPERVVLRGVLPGL